MIHGHHLQVMLNRDVSYQPDPTLLEEPSHVMLNHFYAQVHNDDDDGHDHDWEEGDQFKRRIFMKGGWWWGLPYSITFFV